MNTYLELNRVINMLMAHPDNEPNSEFADKIDSLIDLREKLSNRFEDSKFIGNVLLSYRHDFGLLSKEDRDNLRFECKEWMRAIKNNENNL